MLMPGRTYGAASGYRFGFNGQEKSTEINSDGNSTTAEFWQYDARIGTRWNLDPKPSVGISQYACFANNPIWYSDILGDTTVPTPGNKLAVLPTNAAIETYDLNEEYKVNGKPVSAKPGELRSFTIDKVTYQAKWNPNTLQFLGYFDSKGNSGKNLFLALIDNSEMDFFDGAKLLGTFLWHWGSPVKNADLYVSAQIKDDQRLNLPSNRLFENSKFTWTIAGAQVGYNTDNGGGYYGQIGSFNNSYIDFGLYPNGHSIRFSPFSGSLLSIGNLKGSGDFNIQGRSLIRIANYRGIDFQLDFTYTKSKFQTGFRTKGEMPIPFAGGNQKFEAASGARLQWAWPRVLQVYSPSLFGR